MPLGPYRNRIDAIDDQILALLDARAGVAAEIAEAKREAGKVTFHDPEREEQVLDRLQTKGAGGRFPAPAIRSVFREIISACLALEQPLRVAFLGPEGTFSHMAARHLFGLAARYREAMTIDGVFDAVRTGDVTYGVVPVENSTEGSVTVTVDALIEGDLSVRQEFVLDVVHCLLGTGTGLAGIERIYSHPQPLAQCRMWLAKNVPNAQLVQTTSTTAAAREALVDERSAAIGSRLAAELYGLATLREGIQDRAENATRFLVIAKSDAPPTGCDKTTIAFSVREGRGALRHVLGVFDDAGINLTRIESRPSRQKRWDYVFLADLEGHRAEPRVAGAIDALRAQCDMVKILGSYPRK